MKQLLVKLIILALTMPILLSAQQVWPGDVNNNGTVSGVDLLYLGVAFDAVGPSREEEETDWIGQPLPELWSENFPDGINYAYADCDGNGIVEEDDFDKAIEDNFGLTHDQVMADGYVNGQPETDPSIRLEAYSNFAMEGDTVLIDLKLDDTNAPINDFYGIALKMSYTAHLVESDEEPDFDLTEDEWVEQGNTEVYDLIMGNNTQGIAELAITRTDQVGVPVEPGVIGQISIVIEDIIVGLSVDTLRLEIDSVLVINNELGAIPVAPGKVEIIVAKRTKWPPAKLQSLPKGIKVYPNPAKGILYGKLVDEGEAIGLLNNLGMPVKVSIQTTKPGTFEIQCRDLPPGIYYLQRKKNHSIEYEKIILL